jgi:hypothetical protein
MIELRKVLGLSLILIVAFLVTPGLVKAAGKPEPKSKSKQTSDADVGNTTSASKTGTAPDGTLRPVTPAEEKKLQAEILKTLSHYRKHQPKKNADGSLSLVVAPFSLSASVAERTADGKIKIDCTQDLQNPALQTQKATAKNNSEIPPEE